jgi:hypothetical protein
MEAGATYGAQQNLRAKSGLLAAALWIYVAAKW